MFSTRVWCWFQLLAYQRWGASSSLAGGALLAVAGLLVNGPYALITTAVSADLGECTSPSLCLPPLNNAPPDRFPSWHTLTGSTMFAGTHSSLAGNSAALATVTAIIDGTGSVGTYLHVT